MEFQSPIADGPTRAVRTQRAWLARIVLSGAFALVLVALSGTGAAASEPIGTLVDEATQVLDTAPDAVTEASAPLVEPIAPAAEPVVAPVTAVVGPVLEPIAPEVPSLPSLPLAPVTPPALPIAPLAELAAADLPGLVDPMADVPLATSHIDPRPDPVEPSITGADGPLTTFAEDIGEAGAAVAQGLEQIVDAAIPSATFMGDGGTIVMAGLLIGLAMVVAAGWFTLVGQVWPRPIGLQLTPPVPPG